MVELSEVFYAMLLSTLAGFSLTLIKHCYKSKCSSIDICCLKIIRNIDAEVKEDIELGDRDESKK